MKRLFPVLAPALLVSILAFPARGHGPARPSGEPRPAAGEAAMQAQHRRMARFQDAAQKLTQALIASDRKNAEDAAALLARSLEGHESDVPHKDRSRPGEFHGLFAELGRRTGALRAGLSAGTLRKAAAAYGRVLEVCVSCQVKFRD